MSQASARVTRFLPSETLLPGLWMSRSPGSPCPYRKGLRGVLTGNGPHEEGLRSRWFCSHVPAGAQPCFCLPAEAAKLVTPKGPPEVAWGN